jgi:hypothetical protein
MWSKPQLGKGGSPAIEAGGVWKATTKPWGSVVAPAGLSSNCPAPTDQPNRAPCHRGGVRHQSAHRKQSNMLLPMAAHSLIHITGSTDAAMKAVERGLIEDIDRQQA